MIMYVFSFNLRNYLELMVELPWSKNSKDALDVLQARFVELVYTESYLAIYMYIYIVT